MTVHHESYTLIAESLRNTYQRLQSKVLSEKKHRPTWTVSPVDVTNEHPTGEIVEEFAEILQLAITLERIVRAAGSGSGQSDGQ